MISLAVGILYTLYQLLLSQQQATIVFAGDAMMHKGQLDTSKRPDGSYDYSECFAAVAPEVSAADFAVVNLETTLGGKPYAGYPCFCSPDTLADALAAAGFDLFLQANNHTLDRRDKGLRRTIEVLDRKGIAHIGTYASKEQRRQALPCIKNINGFNVAFLNYTYGTNGIVIQGDVVVDYIDREQIKADIAEARSNGAELVCVAIHWGIEYKLLPNAEQKSLANFLVDQGVDMVIGGHPHVIQPMEMRTDANGRNHLIIYSLGNFISDMKTTDTRGGAMAKVWISRGLDGSAKLDSAAYRLVFTIPGTPSRRSHRLIYPDSISSSALTPEDARWTSAASAFAASARKIFSAHNLSVPEY